MVLDANVLYPARLRDLFVRLAIAGMYQARWTDQILDECFRSIISDRPDLSEAALERTRRLMDQALPQALVEGYEDRIEKLDLPDPDDRHVLAAAIEAGTDLIVTSNLQDFPSAHLEEHDLRAVTPDDFVAMLTESDLDAVRTVIHQQVTALKDPPMTVEEFLDALTEVGLQRSVAALR